MKLRLARKVIKIVDEIDILEVYIQLGQKWEGLETKEMRRKLKELKKELKGL